jgi:hypothetical protein
MRSYDTPTAGTGNLTKRQLNELGVYSTVVANNSEDKSYVPNGLGQCP